MYHTCLIKVYRGTVYSGKYHRTTVDVARVVPVYVGLHISLLNSIYNTCRECKIFGENINGSDRYQYNANVNLLNAYRSEPYLSACHLSFEPHPHGHFICHSSNFIG